jgi:hypothetical protein
VVYPEYVDATQYDPELEFNYAWFMPALLLGFVPKGCMVTLKGAYGIEILLPGARISLDEIKRGQVMRFEGRFEVWCNRKKEYARRRK